jgi:carbon monoxide dehydrogenase subunit G
VQLEHSFSVPVGIDEAWKILLDIERIGPCLPGTAIDSIEGDDVTGTVKVKLGPINLTYKGKARFVEKDEAEHRAVIDARGEDARGNSSATALVTATLAESEGTTTVQVNTDLDITGKPAQFGRGVMVDVGTKLIGQFAHALAATLGMSDEPPAAESSPAPKHARQGTAKAAQPPAAVAQAEAAPGEPAPEAVASAEDAELPAAQPIEVPTDPDDSTPSYAAPGGIPTSSNAVSSVSAVNGHLPGAKPEVEMTDLLEHAKPAIAKRIAPVAVALVVVAVAMRRRSGKRP